MADRTVFILYCLLTVSVVFDVIMASKAAEDEKSNTNLTTTTVKATSSSTKQHSRNDTISTQHMMDSSMIRRSLYVLIGITSIGVLYFLVRAVRVKKSSTPRKKYGLLTNYDDTVEMAQLESDEDDNTVYEAKSLRR